MILHLKINVIIIFLDIIIMKKYKIEFEFSTEENLFDEKEICKMTFIVKYTEHDKIKIDLIDITVEDVNV